MQLCKKCLEVFGAEVHFSYRLLKGDLKRIRKRLNLNKLKMKLLLIINLPFFISICGVCLSQKVANSQVTATKTLSENYKLENELYDMRMQNGFTKQKLHKE